MTKLVAHWVPHECKGNRATCKGGVIELTLMPTKGQRELKELSIKNSDMDALYSQYQFINICQAIFAAEAVLGKLGVEKAKESWDDYVVAELEGTRLFIWPKDTFAENLLLTKTRFMYQQLAAVNDDEARKKLSDMEESIKKNAVGIDKEQIARVGARPLLALYWRLRDSGLTHVLTPAGLKAIDWDLKKKDEALELLSEVADETTYAQLVEKRKRAFDMEDLKPLSPADVEGKAETPSTPSTPSRLDSTPSSESPMETTTQPPP